jgi:hypothetical protein
MPRLLSCVAPLLIVIVACSDPPKGFKPRDQMSQREKDSVIGASGLPGAKVVRSALIASDSAASRNSVIDSASQQN